jgi:hypothetical protein
MIIFFSLPLFNLHFMEVVSGFILQAKNNNVNVGLVLSSHVFEVFPEFEVFSSHYDSIVSIYLTTYERIHHMSYFLIYCVA